MVAIGPSLLLHGSVCLLLQYIRRVLRKSRTYLDDIHARVLNYIMSDRHIDPELYQKFIERQVDRSS